MPPPSPTTYNISCIFNVVYQVQCRKIGDFGDFVFVIPICMEGARREGLGWVPSSRGFCMQITKTFDMKNH